jgi:hypothetical protein
MNDDTLIAAVLREVAAIAASIEDSIDVGAIQMPGTMFEMLKFHLLERADELDPPEKNERPTDN